MVLRSYTIKTTSGKLDVSESEQPNTIKLTLSDFNSSMCVGIDKRDWISITKLTDGYSSNFNWSGHEGNTEEGSY